MRRTVLAVIILALVFSPARVFAQSATSVQTAVLSATVGNPISTTNITTMPGTPAHNIATITVMLGVMTAGSCTTNNSVTVSVTDSNGGFVAPVNLGNSSIFFKGGTTGTWLGAYVLFANVPAGDTVQVSATSTVGTCAPDPVYQVLAKIIY